MPSFTFDTLWRSSFRPHLALALLLKVWSNQMLSRSRRRNHPHLLATRQHCSSSRAGYLSPAVCLVISRRLVVRRHHSSFSRTTPLASYESLSSSQATLSARFANERNFIVVQWRAVASKPWTRVKDWTCLSATGCTTSSTRCCSIAASGRLAASQGMWHWCSEEEWGSLDHEARGQVCCYDASIMWTSLAAVALV